MQPIDNRKCESLEVTNNMSARTNRSAKTWLDIGKNNARKHLQAEAEDHDEDNVQSSKLEEEKRASESQKRQKQRTSQSNEQHGRENEQKCEDMARLRQHRREEALPEAEREDHDEDNVQERQRREITT